MCSRTNGNISISLACRDSTWPNLEHFEHQKRIITVVSYIGRKIHESIVILKYEKGGRQWKWHYQKMSCSKHIRNDWIRKSLFCNHKGNNWFSQEPPVDTEIIGEKLLIRCLVAQCSPLYTTCYFKGKMSSFSQKDLVDTVLTK